MTHTFDIPSRFHPGYSLLGRWLRRRTGDARRAEACHILVLTGAVLLLLLAHAAAWALLPAGGGPAVWRWSMEAAYLLLVFAVGVWGRRPAAVIACAPEALRIEQGRCRLDLPYDAVEAVNAITPLRFHRHERRYAATQAFVGHLDHDLLLLTTARGPVVIGLAPEDHAAFRTCLQSARAGSSSPLPQDVR